MRPGSSAPFRNLLSRRDFLKVSGLVGPAPSSSVPAQALVSADYTLDIAPATIESSPRHRLDTVSSPTEVHWLALAGHSFRVIAMDGNAVPSPQRLSMIRLAPAERVSAVPGATLFHCHQQNHMDLGFMLLFDYA